MSKRRKRQKAKARRRMLVLGLTSLLIIFATSFTIGKYWVEIFDKYQEKNNLDKELTNLREREEELKSDANKLQNPDYIARYAREKYLYSKDGEIILQIPEE